MFGISLVALGLLAAVVLLATAASAQPAPEAAKFVSAKPLFLKLAMGGEQAPVVAVAFDESKGTGSGYDLVYIDSNLNGVLEPGEKHSADAGAGTATFNVPLPDTLFPATVTGEGVQKSVTARFLVYSLGALEPSAMVTLNLRLTQGEQVWNYSLTSSGATTARSLEEAKVLHAGPIALAPTVRPGAACGIAARLQAGDFSFNCAGPDGASSNVTILIQTQSGEVAHRETVPLGRLGFG